MKVSELKREWFWISGIIGIGLIMISVFLMGGGHGYYEPSAIMFPLPTLLMFVASKLFPLIILLAFIQYPIYSYFIFKAEILNRYSRIGILLLFHFGFWYLVSELILPNYL